MLILYSNTMSMLNSPKKVLLISSSFLTLFFLAFLLQNNFEKLSGNIDNQQKLDSLETKEVEKLDPQFLPISSLKSNFTFEIIGSDSSAKDLIFENFGKDYSSSDSLSIFCFRGNQERNNPSRGKIKNKPTQVALDWVFKTDYDNTITEYGQWGGGAGWTGQPLVIHWTKDQKNQLGIKDEKFLTNDSSLEVIIGSLCGNIYFLNAETGTPTRKHLSIDNPIKGTISVDPRKNGLLYVGQGIQHKERLGAYVFDMFKGTEILHIKGIDSDARRRWGSFDSNPIIEEKSGTVFWPAENGLIYKFTIDANKNVGKISKLRYKHDQLKRAGIESSMAVIGQYGFVSDNSGTVMSIDLKTMNPVWNVSNMDDSDATITIDTEAPGKHFLYTGNEVDLTGPISNAYFRKVDPITGEEVWKVSRECFGTPINGKTNSGGILSSPVIGKAQGSHLVYTVFSRVNKQNKGEFIAIDKKTGKEVFSVLLDNYSWSSPVDIYDEAGNVYIFLTDVFGTIYLLDGLTGGIIFKEKTNYVFESSPVVVKDQIFIASRGNSILSFKIKS